MLAALIKHAPASAKNDSGTNPGSFVREEQGINAMPLFAQLYAIFGIIQKEDWPGNGLSRPNQGKLSKSVALSGLSFFLLLAVSFVNGQTLIPNTNAITQNFDSMGSSTSLPSNWRMHASTSSPSWNSAGTSVTQQASSGSPTQGGTYNFGSSSSERSIGAMTSGSFGSPNNLLGFFQNSNAGNLTSLTVSYEAERYRINSAAASVQFYYSLNGSTWVAVTAGDIATSSFPTGGNAYNFTSGTVVAKSNIAITGLNIATGGAIYLRWNINTTGTNSQGIAIDDIRVVAAFAPTTPTITGSATTSAFSSTYGTASGVQNFSVSGASLTDNLVANAPAGFEVSSNGTTYGGTATFTQSGGNASGTLRIRLAADAPVGTYNSRIITLTSTGASTVNITTPSNNNIMSAKAVTISGISAVSRAYDGTAIASLNGGSYSGLVNSESFSLAGTPVAVFGNKVVGINKPVTVTGFTAPSANYTLTAQPSGLSANITAAELTIPDAAVTAKTYDGLTNATITGTLTGIIGDDAVTFSSGTSFFATSGPGTGIEVTSLCELAGDDAENYTLIQPSGLTGDINAVTSPTISVNPVSAAALSTVYGTASEVQSFTVTGSLLNNDIIATAGAGFEVSLDGTSFSTSVIFTQSGGNAGGVLYVRLSAAALTADYNNMAAITLSSAGASDFILNTTASGNSVSAKALTITGLSGVNKVYDGNSSAQFIGTPEYSGLANGETFSVSGTGTASFASKTAESNKTVTILGFTAPSANYTLTDPTVTADITSVSLTVSGATVTTRPYNGTTTATITGASLVGVIADDVVTVSGNGTFASANVGTGIEVTSALTLGGTDAVNYTLEQPILSGEITKASQTITGLASTNTRSNTDNPYTLTAVASSGLPVSYTSSNEAVATISGSTVTIVGIAGTTTITASQAGDSNYDAAPNVVQTLTVNAGPSTLSVGDIALAAVNSGNPDTFSVVLLRNINANTVINFTDNGFTGSNTTGRTGEGFLTYTAPTALPFGTVLTWTNGISATGWSSSAPTNFAFNASGDQLYIFQGDTSNWSSQSGIKLLFGLNYGTALSSTSSASNTLQPSTSILPASAFLNLPSSSNVYYSGNGSTATAVDLCGTAPVIFGNLLTAAKWYGSSSANSFPTYTISSSCSRISVTGTATAFTTTYGTPSAIRTFSVTGAELTANLVAAAPAGFEVSADGITYDTTATFAQVSGDVSGLLRVRLAATAAVGGAYNSKNIVLSSTGAASVNIITTASGNIVSPKALTITGISAENKTYDGTVSVSVNGTPEYSGLVNDETFSVAGTPSYAFGDKNAGIAKPILVTGFTAPSANYTVSQPSLSAEITAKDLNVSNITANSKVYDGTVEATLSAVLEGVIAPDNVTLTATGEFENNYQTIFFGVPANIINLSFSLGGIASDIENYTLVQPVVDGLTADIYPKELTISNPTASDKIFDGNTDAVVTGTLEGIISGDTVTLISSGVFASSAIGSNILVTPTWAIDGDTFNYTLTEPTAELRANITSAGAPIITSAATASATYADLATSYTITTNIAADSYGAAGLPDGLTINAATGEITGSPAAAGTFTVTLSATANGETGYASLTYTIERINLSITGAVANDKPYDGTTAAIISGTLTGLIPEDDVSFDGNGAFDVALVGTNIFVTPNIALTGTKASNYTLAQPSGLFADITAKMLTVTASVNDKVYAGSTATAAVIAVESVNGIVGSDAVNIVVTGTFDTGFAGEGKNVTVNYTVAGADAANYGITTPVTLTGNITKKPLTFTATAENKVFDGNTNAVVTASAINGIVAPDAVTIAGTGTFASSAVGNNITVGNVVMVLGGAHAANYSIAQPGDLSANITSGPTVLAAGDIAIIGYNSGGSPDNFAILALKDLTAGTQFFVNDNELASASSMSFADMNEFEASFTVKTGQTIPAGTVITLPWGANAVSTATYDWSSTSGAGLGNNNEELYIYTAPSLASSTATLFIYYAKIGSSTSAIPSSLVTSTNGSGTTAITPNGPALRYSTTGNIFSSCKQILLNEIGKTATTWNATGATSIAANDWSFTVLPECPSPTIETTGTVTALTAEYGSASSNGTFNISGSYLTDNIVLTAPAGFEISLSPTSGFAGTLTLAQASGTVASAAVYIRLTAANLVGSYSGDIIGTTTGGNTVNVTIPSSTVTPKPLTIAGIFINNKVENLGDFTATISGTPTLNGVLPADNADVSVDSSAATAVFTQDNAGTNIAVIVSGYVLSGSAAANYSLTQPTGLTADITTVASPAITSALTFSSVYGVEIAAPYQLTATTDPMHPITAYNAVNLPSGLTFDSNTQAIIGTPTAAGNYTVTVSASNAGGTTNAILIYTISQKEITVDAAAQNKIYDSNDTAAITVNTILGVVGSDDVTVSGGGSFDSKNAGIAKTVTPNLTLGGVQSANYILTQPTGLSASIAPFALTLTGAAAQNKVFDGTNAATIVAMLNGEFAGDDVTFNGTGTFASSAVGNGIAVTSTATLAGADAGNYSFDQPTGLTANITDTVLYANVFTGASACPTNGNVPTMAANAAGTPLTRASVSCMSTGNVFNSTTLNNTATVSNASYIEFSATAAAGHQLNVRSLSFFRQASNSAPNQLEVRYSTDGFATSTTMAGTPVSPTSGTVLTWDFADFNTPNAGTVTFRLYPYGTQRADLTAPVASVTGTFRVDDVAIFGAVVTSPAATLSLVGNNTVCTGETSSVKIDIENGISPYTVVYQNETTSETFTANNYASGSSISVTPAATGNNVYSLVSVTDANGSIATLSGTADIIAQSCSTESVVNLKLFIQGYYDADFGAMRAVKFNQSFGVAADNEVEDLTIELFDADTQALVATTTATLHTDGTLQASFASAPSGNYWLAVKGSNLIKTWSATPVAVGSTPLAYDFTTAAEQSFGSNMIQVGSVWTFYSGDIDQNGNVDTGDYPTWEDDYFNFASGAYASDLDGNGNVDTGDYPFWEINYFNFVSSIAPF